MDKNKYMVGDVVKCDCCKREFTISEIIEQSKGKQVALNICPACKRISNYFLKGINRIKSFAHI